jgi:hypothetical protein
MNGVVASDGHTVAFTSIATNLIPDIVSAPTGQAQVYLLRR